jgi:AraC-like DNA-binding protein
MPLLAAWDLDNREMPWKEITVDPIAPRVLGFSVVTRWVDAFWAFESSGAPHRVLPDGCIDFIFDLKAGRAIVQGPMTRAEVFVLPAGSRVFGVRFAPGAGRAFVDTEAHALEDRSADLEDVTRAARSWRLAERVAEAENDVARRHLIGEFLLDPGARRRAVDGRLQRAVRAIQQSRGSVSVSTIARDLGISERTLERLFRDQVGVGPKLYARIVRLEWTRAAALGHQASQADLALLGGYADEPHLLREFRALTGVTPFALLAEDRVGFVQVDGTVST